MRETRFEMGMCFMRARPLQIINYSVTHSELEHTPTAYQSVIKYFILNIVF